MVICEINRQISAGAKQIGFFQIKKYKNVANLDSNRLVLRFNQSTLSCRIFGAKIFAGFNARFLSR